MTVILLRHGRSTANTSGVLAGRSPGVHLDDRGREQADDLVSRLGDHLAEIRAIVRSPLDRCAETVAPLLAALGTNGDRPPEVVVDDLAEVDYGGWTGRSISELLSEPLWKVVQQQPSAAVFPDGEGLADVQARAVRAIRELDRVYGGPDGSGVWVACSHGDVIKSIVADAMGSHLDAFQRIVVEPASISVIRYASSRPYVHTVNNTQKLSIPTPRPPTGDDQQSSDDAVVGGDTGATATIPATSG
ncbi:MULTISPECIES: MSMEG_4193 family putative phosphomutase [Gordonia]|jgi:probable phosphomutase (TIGR03848 family)|uniref:Phosphoglycerate kinase n=2 Tax=Gordonia alkanivorans TaxID=84096 RepID=W9DIU3_9ACTN|nr:MULTISPECIES: MSMEG_4193 family putative phosphomutase [Gordonia]AZZ82204.1 MSMEG_4193 family putative phosphomutase [Gordonia alkanivorans]ETA06461.1 phosphoglycerate kinase [Gordonia alkanivorans CGMCC 6845]MDH3006660.1 MSMEG_4193 family putative phosphomutase [Gordonia alkanivorans]MDH3009975.1 MSMEG_4193 family putative phosphomutase [Gordonia alkanivorans]MDH3014419.1 MSMEG_4193 family putative phosphomutase [Gordonia alkanivorans]